MNHSLTLADIQPGERCLVSALLATGGMRRRLLDLGVVENAPILCIGRAPADDPSAYLLCGAVIAIRACDARGIVVRRPCDGA
ncbi:MAG: ferrous iron transport protein A [Clostridia bacterium]|nr:ferrous iron transport protein A [Clostridia bacterium]